MRRKKNYYNTHNNYRVRKNRIVLVAIVGICFVIGLIVFLNYNRISMLSKGYSWSETSVVLKTFEKEDEKVILSYDRLDHIVAWVALSDTVEHYSYYQQYYDLIQINSDDDSLDYFDEHVNTVEFIDTLYSSLYPTLEELGYSEDHIWSLIPQSSIEEFEYVVEHAIAYSTVQHYLNVPTFKFSNALAYVEAYEEYNDYNYSVGIVNFPGIISSNNVSDEYVFNDPDNILNLVKKGFYLDSNYEPSDLVKPEIPIADESDDDFMVRKEAADALLLMYEAAKKEDMHILLNSAYRSYDKQAETYTNYENWYGGLYASEYVATPGASEHQTGLGIDLTSQSVLDGERMVFGDTDEYQWVLQNAHLYGFIVRFDEDSSDITGISHEPWHLRYLGVETSKDVYESGLTYEEYCLYNALFPNVSKK